jgi:hypothetical protein
MKRMGIEALYHKPNTSEPTPRIQDIPPSAAKAARDAPQSGLGDGHHLYSRGAGLHLSGCRAGLFHASGAVLAGINLDTRQNLSDRGIVDDGQAC